MTLDCSNLVQLFIIKQEKRIFFEIQLYNFYTKVTKRKNGMALVDVTELK